MARLVKRKAAVSGENAVKKTRRNAPAAEPRTSEIVIGERLASSVSAIVAGAPVTPASLAEKLMIAAKRVPKPAEQTPPREIENAARLITNALRSLCGPGSAVEVDAVAKSGSEEEDRAVVPMSGGGGDMEVVVVSMDVLGTVPVGDDLVTPDTSSGPVSSASAPAPTNVRLAVPCSQTGQPSCATPSSPTPVSPDGDVDGSDNTSSWLSDILEGCDEGPNTSTSGMCGPQPVNFGGSTDGVENSSDDSMACSARNEQPPQLRATPDAAALDVSTGAALSPSSLELTVQLHPAAATAPANGGDAFTFAQDAAMTDISPFCFPKTFPSPSSTPPKIRACGARSELATTAAAAVAAPTATAAPSASAAISTGSGGGGGDGSTSGDGATVALAAAQLQPEDSLTLTTTSGGNEADSACSPQRDNNNTSCRLYSGGACGGACGGGGDDGGGSGAQAAAAAASSFHNTATGGDVGGEEMSSPSRCEQGVAAPRSQSPAPQLPAAKLAEAAQAEAALAEATMHTSVPEQQVEGVETQRALRKRKADAQPASDGPEVCPPGKQQRVPEPEVALPPLGAADWPVDWSVDWSKPAWLPSDMPAEFVFVSEHSLMVMSLHDFIVAP